MMYAYLLINGQVLIFQQLKYELNKQKQEELTAVFKFTFV